MPPAYGNLSIGVKEHIPGQRWNHFHMTKRELVLRQRLSKNLGVVLKTRGLSGNGAAAIIKMDDKGFNNVLRARFDHRLSIMERIANGLGLGLWQLLAFDFDAARPIAGEAAKLLEFYVNADDDGRDAILRVAAAVSGKTASPK